MKSEKGGRKLLVYENIAMARLSEWKVLTGHHASKDVYCALIFMLKKKKSQEMYIVGNHNINKSIKQIQKTSIRAQNNH